MHRFTIQQIAYLAEHEPTADLRGGFKTRVKPLPFRWA